ncbi:hypothetical protein FHX48_001239 [Microbacterium halimionae]|uniref:Uncharacterized protein n=1 Tax=Microbacterium halimionae TaxID=1526413 RepID=A0A7W3JNQ9_9MICO|nr:hypothetical protein [Microbacterium halimionae]NII96368.1 hypothetical protein [Microbacterium halimionae]
MSAVELRPEETRSPLEYLVGPPQLADLLLQLPHPTRLGRAHPGDGPVVDVGLLDPHPPRLDAVSELRRDPMNRPMIGPQLPPRRVLTIRTAGAISSGEYRRVIGFPDACSFDITHPRFQGQESPTNSERFN